MRTKLALLLLPFLVGAAITFGRPAHATCHNELTDAAGDGSPAHEDHTYSYFPAADITAAWMQPAVGYPAMEFGVSTKEAFERTSGQNFNVFFFLDIDADASNNDPDGTRAGADTAYSLLWGAENREWKTIAWSYDASSDTWISVQDNSILFAPLDLGDGFIIHVPYELVPEDTHVPFRAAVAISEKESETSTRSMVDTAPDGEGAKSACEDGEHVTIGTTQDDGPSESAAPTSTERNPLVTFLYGLVILLLLGGTFYTVNTKTKEARGKQKAGGTNEGKDQADDEKDENQQDDSESEDEQTEEITDKKETPVAVVPGEKITCDCLRCSLYICVGSKSDKAIGSALNLGKAIKRDTEAGGKKRCCVRVMHFRSKSMQLGRYVGYSKKGALEWKKFAKRKEGIEKDGHAEVCMWNEVMIVMHGEKKSKVKAVVQNIAHLIPKAPIKRLVLYYCGGGATLPEAEFKALAATLGRRLKNIPKECRPSYVELFIAPTVSFKDIPTYTVLSINKDGLTSFEGKMMKYTADEKGKVQQIGNEVPSGRLFGCVELGELESTPAANASTYMSHWRRICKLPLSEIRRYRTLIRKANMRTKKGKLIEPPKCRKEVMGDKIENTLEQHGAEPISPAELDDLAEKSSRAIKKAVKARIKASR